MENFGPPRAVDAQLRRDDRDGHHAGPDMGTEDGTDLAEPDLAVLQPLAEPVAEALGQLGRAVGAGQVCDRDVDLGVTCRLDGELLEPAQRLGRGAHLLERADPAVVDPSGSA